MLVVNVLTLPLGLRLLVGSVTRDHKLNIYLPGLPALFLVLVDRMLAWPRFGLGSSTAPEAHETAGGPVP